MLSTPPVNLAMSSRTALSQEYRNSDVFSSLLSTEDTHAMVPAIKAAVMVAIAGNMVASIVGSPTYDVPLDVRSFEPALRGRKLEASRRGRFRWRPRTLSSWWDGVLKRRRGRA